MDKKRILVAEDELTTLKYYQNVLEKHNYTVDTVTDGKEAFDKLLGNDYDVILTDWMMPKIDGINLIRDIRKEIDNPPIIIMITALGSEMSKKHALSSGADAFLMKPVQTQDMLKLIDDIFNISEQKVDIATPEIIKPDINYSNLPEHIAVGIAASTGGPKTVTELFKKMSFTNKATYFLVQHGPAWMFQSFAERIEELTPFKTIVCTDDMPIDSGNIYIAPGDFHIKINPETMRIQLDSGPRENFVRPSADPLFRSIALSYGRYSIGVVLTGLGADGANGANAIYQSGGKVLVQDPETAIAKSMPNAVIKNKIPHTLVQIDEMPKSIWSNIYSLSSVLKKKH